MERSFWIGRILEADDRFLAQHPESTLFAYFAGTPNKSVLHNVELLENWRTDEVERERRARRGARWGVLRPGPPSFRIFGSCRKYVPRLRVAESRVVLLESELQAMRSNALYSRTRRLVDSKWVRTARGNRFMAGLRAADQGVKGRTRLRGFPRRCLQNADLPGVNRSTPPA